MVARRKPAPRKPSQPEWHEGFMRLLPGIRKHARHAFRNLRDEARDEAIAETTANALVAYARLVEKGKADIGYATPLAMFAIKQFHCGRRTGTKLNVKDISSPYCQTMKGVRVGRLDRFDDEEGFWKEILIEDKNAGPAEIAASRMDFAGWLKTLSRRDRKLALKLATGETTGTVSQLFKISAGRISQIRRELMESWRRFVGEEPMPAPEPA
jgi:rhamnogalacturonyl hydrolase YesR